MAFALWSDDFSIGIPSIDEQHRWLFDATNKLHDELQKPEVHREVVLEVLEGLMDYTMNHFIVEEELFERYQYTDAQAHKALHDKFTASVMDLLTKFEDGEDLGKEVLDLVKNWLINHIQRTDKEYAAFLKAHGVSIH
jgi:hemerythrin